MKPLTYNKLIIALCSLGLLAYFVKDFILPRSDYWNFYDYFKYVVLAILLTYTIKKNDRLKEQQRKENYHEKETSVYSSLTTINGKPV